MTDAIDNSKQVGTNNAAQQAPSPPPSPPPPRGPRLRVIVLMTALLAGGIGFGIALHEPLSRGFDSAYAAISGGDHDGVAESGAAADGVQYYTCGMHPWVIEPEPGLCPICHMELTPLDPGKFGSELTIDPTVVQNMGVRLASVEQGPLHETVRTVGTVTYDQTAVRNVNTKVAGWIEKLHVDREGQYVEQGEPLLELYSPELVAAQQEYLLAHRNHSTNGADADMLESARTRLRYFDMTDAQIAALEQRGTPQRVVTLHSPHAGVVTVKHANEGMRVSPEMRLYQIADLSAVWVMASIYESQLPYIKEGQTARMHLTYSPDRTFKGEVAEVYPYLDRSNRQATARLRFDNSDGTLKPGMYATIELESTLAQEAMLVPLEAVIDTGDRQLVMVSLGDGRFEPREVTTGVQNAAGRMQILDGLAPGEKIVISGQFLLDSESRTREALAKMVQGEQAATQQPETKPADNDSLQPLSEHSYAQLTTLIERYMAIGDALHKDRIDSVSAQAQQLLDALNALTVTDPPGAPHFWHEHHDTVSTIRHEAQTIIEERELKKIRSAYDELSAALETLLKRTGVPASYNTSIERVVCGMFTDGTHNGLWLQPADTTLRNPYMGAMMPQCHQSDTRQHLPVADSPPAAPVSQPAPTQPQAPANSDTPHSH